MNEQQRRIIRSGCRGGMTDWAMVEVAAMIGRPKLPPSDIDVALESVRLNLRRPSLTWDTTPQPKSRLEGFGEQYG